MGGIFYLGAKSWKKTNFMKINSRVQNNLSDAFVNSQLAEFFKLFCDDSNNSQFKILESSFIDNSFARNIPE